MSCLKPNGLGTNLGGSTSTYFKLLKTTWRQSDYVLKSTNLQTSARRMRKINIRLLYYWRYFTVLEKTQKRLSKLNCNDQWFLTTLVSSALVERHFCRAALNTTKTCNSLSDNYILSLQNCPIDIPFARIDPPIYLLDMINKLANKWAPEL